MATKKQIESQLVALGCGHTLPHLRSAAFIFLHINPGAFDRLEARTGARIAEQRSKTVLELVAAVDPMLWVDTAKIVCDRFGDGIHAEAGPALRAFMNAFPGHVPKWIPVAVFLLLAIPKDAGAEGERLRQRAMGCIKTRALEENVKRVTDHVRHAALSIYSGVEHGEIAHAYITVFQTAYK